MTISRLLAAFSAMMLVSACSAIPESRGRPPIFIPPRTTPAKPRPTPLPANYLLRPPPGMVESIRSVWAGYPDRTGIAVIRSDGNWVIEHRGGELMPQWSVSKLWVGIALMQAVDEGRLRLSDPVTLTGSDVVVFSRSMEQLIDDDGYQTTLGELLNRAMTVSDNSANDYLMRKLGGPEAIRAMISAKGLGAIRFGPGENRLFADVAGLPWRPEYARGRNFQNARALLSAETRRAAMNRYLADPVDGASPIAIARALLRLKRGELLSSGSTQLLLSMMAASETGKQRLRAGVPFGWSFAHKTGTGQEHLSRTAGYNDVSLMTAPDGTSYAVVVMIADTDEPVPDRMQMMQGVSSSVGANHIR